MRPFTGNPVPSRPTGQEEKAPVQEKESALKTLFERRSAILWNLVNRGAASSGMYSDELHRLDQEIIDLGSSVDDYNAYTTKKRQELH
jgi:hypothetical protein